jgi:glycosyltransferase 2 family protein
VGKIWYWLRWPVAVGILVFLWWQNGEHLKTVWDSPKNWGMLVAAFVLILGSTLLTFVRWYLLVRAQRFEFRLADAVRLGFFGLLCNFVGPGAVGGDVAKAFFLARQQASRRTVAVATVFLDRVLGLLALFVLGAIAAAVHPPLPGLPQLIVTSYILWGGSLAGILGLIAMLTPALTHHSLMRKLEGLPLVGKPFGEMLHGVELYQSSRGTLAAALGISVVCHAGIIVGFYFCAVALQPIVPSLLTHFYFMPIAETLSVFIPTPAGIGALEGAIQKFYGVLLQGKINLKEAEAAGFIAAMAFRAVTLVVAALGGVYYAASRSEASGAMEPTEVPLPSSNPASEAA